ncbi:MAG: polymerase subunit epsilon [Gaiellaceae bacterium]|nr:polymerase subunit epsilon [Gaiellaceae bacterium]
MQLRLDAADRLVELVEERRGPVAADEAARRVFALARTPTALARSLLDETVRDDARLAWRGDAVALAAPLGADLALESATYVVVDLETTGLRPGSSRICEIGAVRVRGFELEEEFQTLVNPREPLGAVISALTGLEDAELRRAPPVEVAMRRFLAFAGDAVLVAHNARFDLGFLDWETQRLTGSRIASPVVDTVGLARKLLAGRIARANLGALAYFFGTDVRPCHRALPDAQATAEILVGLLGLAQERGAETVADLAELAATRPRRVYGKRSLAFGAPQRPGVYLFRDRNETVLYVGRARDLRARLRSYFTSDRQRPAVEAALGALERIEWRPCGSEVEAALEELRLLRELRPPANARSARPDRYVYLRARGQEIVCSSKPSPLGPLRSRRLARLAARALRPDELENPAAALPRLGALVHKLAGQQRYEDAARMQERVEALEQVLRALATLERLRALERCLVVPALEEGWHHAFFVVAGQVAAKRKLPPGAGAALEVASGLAAARAAAAEGVSYAPELADELLALGTFMRRPPPELRVVPLDSNAILAVCRPGLAKAA